MIRTSGVMSDILSTFFNKSTDFFRRWLKIPCDCWNYEVFSRLWRNNSHWWWLMKLGIIFILEKAKLCFGEEIPLEFSLIIYFKRWLYFFNRLCYWICILLLLFWLLFRFLFYIFRLLDNLLRLLRNLFRLLWYLFCLFMGNFRCFNNYFWILFDLFWDFWNFCLF